LARFDSIARASKLQADLAALELARIQALEKARFDSIANARKQHELDMLAQREKSDLFEKNRRDSLAYLKMMSEEEDRARRVADDLARFDSIARFNAKQAALAKAEASRIMIAEQTRFDSIATARNEQKLWADAQWKIISEIENEKRDSLRNIKEKMLAMQRKPVIDVVKFKIDNDDLSTKHDYELTTINKKKEEMEFYVEDHSNVKLVAYHEARIGHSTKYYGYINFGDGKGNKYLNKEEFDEYAKKYKFIIENE